ncbi:head-tail adaptor protein, partial [Methylobacterium haplocladii]
MTHAPIGARRRRFVLETPVDEPDGFGGQLRRYVAGPVVWGVMARAGTAERVRNGRSEAIATHRVSLRWRPGVTSEMLLSAGPRRFA